MVSYQTLQKEIENARVAELADAHGSGPCESNFMGVQVPPLAPKLQPTIRNESSVVFYWVFRNAGSPHNVEKSRLLYDN